MSSRISCLGSDRESRTSTSGKTGAVIETAGWCRAQLLIMDLPQPSLNPRETLTQRIDGLGHTLDRAHSLAERGQVLAHSTEGCRNVGVRPRSLAPPPRAALERLPNLLQEGLDLTGQTTQLAASDSLPDNIGKFFPGQIGLCDGHRLLRSGQTQARAGEGLGRRSALELEEPSLGQSVPICRARLLPQAAGLDHTPKSNIAQTRPEALE